MAKLHFYYSAMNAGKTTVLLQSNYNYRERGMNTMLFTPSFDDRYALGQITSRIGLGAEAVVFDQDFNFFQVVKTQMEKEPLHCVLVDEAQFLTREQVYQLTEIVDVLGLPVLTYGLRTDFQSEPFLGSTYLMAWAQSLSEIKTICHCGRKATMVLRLDSEGNVMLEGDQVQIGGNDSYVSVCRKHYKAKIAVKTETIGS